jgi:glutamate-1-semialdehyde 2,1-aminomutase
MTNSETLFARAQKVSPGGVNSPVRAFKGVGGTPRFIVSAKGATLTDADGRDYVDYIGSWGPMIVGHAHPHVIQAIESAARRGTSYGTPSPAEVELAEEMIRRIPSLEKVRLVNSGTEATMSAVRLARAATGRNVVMKFAGDYHGHADYFLIKAGSGAATLGIPNSPGVTAGAAADTRNAVYNNLESVEAIFQTDKDNVAAVIVEPVAGNMGVVPPAPGFLSGLRDLCTRYGALLIFDEVMTGFRIHRAGAEGLYNIHPDLSTFGKVIGGGLPVGAYGGRADLMNRVAPEGPVYQAGTLSGNPLAMAAGLATLDLLDEAAYAQLEKISALLESGLVSACCDAGIPAAVQRVGSMITLFFSAAPVTNADQAAAADHARFSRFFTSMLEQGFHLPPSGYEAWFLSLAHTEAIIEKTVATARIALTA